jgi:hypothetical protein
MINTNNHSEFMTQEHMDQIKVMQVANLIGQIAEVIEQLTFLTGFCPQ